MKRYINGESRELTQQELTAWEESLLREEKRPFGEDEALRFVLERLLNTLEVEDATALRLLDFYPPWEPGTEYPEGFLTRYEGALWRSLMGHTSDETTYPQLPGLSRGVLLWEQVAGQG